MSMLIRSFFTLVGVIGAGATGPAEEARVAREGVAELVQLWSDAGEAGDWDAVLNTYADDPGFSWIEQGEVRYRGYASVAAGIERFRQTRVRIDNDVSGIEVTPLSADVAAFRASYSLRVDSDGFSFSSEGILSGVAVRRGPRWQFLMGSLSERPTVPAAPDQLAR
ncbi:MAG TPA: nuclear transport factor 2 family protein [Chthoniobacteraceae bacterium]|jgi:ketosteroid isomerase-like protein